MGKKSTVETLPKEVKEWLDRSLVENNFSGYQLLAEEMKSRGYEVSKSAIHRYGQDFEERLKTLKLVTEQARAVVLAAPDEDGAVNDALVRLTQEKLFSVLMDIEIDPETVDVTKLAKAVAELGKASVAQKRWLAEVRSKAEAAASAIEQVVKKGGLSDEAVDQIRRQILGIAG